MIWDFSFTFEFCEVDSLETIENAVAVNIGAAFLTIATA